MPLPSLTSLADLLRHVELKDDPSPDSPQRPFRQLLDEVLRCAEQVKQYINEALAGSGDQYSRALQDIVTCAGRPLGFEVAYGRYQGVPGQPGYDGLWWSPAGKAVVLETNYATPRKELLGYIYDLAQQGQVQRDKCMGLYVIGHIAPGPLQALEASIQEVGLLRLRVISTDGLVDLLRLKEETQLRHEEVLKLLLPTVNVDNVLNLVRTILYRTPRTAPSPPLSKEGVVTPWGYTPQHEYRWPILKALIELGGSGRRERILKQVEYEMTLRPADYERFKTGEMKWRSYATLERQRMVLEGLLRNDSPFGVWEVTDEGRAWYEWYDWRKTARAGGVG